MLTPQCLQAGILIFAVFGAMLQLTRRFHFRSELSLPWVCGLPIVLIAIVMVPVENNANLIQILIAVVIYLLVLSFYLTERLSAFITRISILTQQMAIANLTADEAIRQDKSRD